MRARATKHAGTRASTHHTFGKHTWDSPEKNAQVDTRAASVDQVGGSQTHFSASGQSTARGGAHDQWRQAVTAALAPSLHMF